MYYKYLVLILIFSTNLTAQDWKKDLWIPPKDEKVDESTYKKYISLLNESNEWIQKGQGDVASFAYFNRFVSYLYLEAPGDTLKKYLHSAIDFNPVFMFDSFQNGRKIANEKQVPTLDKQIPKYFYDEWVKGLKKLDSITHRFNPKLQLELKKIFKDDQEIRNQIDRLESESKQDSSFWIVQLWKKQLTLDSINQSKIAQIINQFGYPGRILVGNELSAVAFYVIQHAPIDYQKQYISFVKSAAENRDLGYKYYCYLVDRILMHKGKKQIFGSQIIRNKKTKAMELYPIENPSNIDEIRKYSGMEPLEEYLINFGINKIQ